LQRALVLAAVVGAVLVVVFSWLVSTRTTKVVGARRDLFAGDRVSLGDVMALEHERSQACDGCVRLDHAATLVGATLLRDVPAGAPLTVRDVAEGGPGLRARGDTSPRRRVWRGVSTVRRGAHARRRPERA
jgi:hypothetical protein